MKFGVDKLVSLIQGLRGKDGVNSVRIVLGCRLRRDITNNTYLIFMIYSVDTIDTLYYYIIIVVGIL
jgi:hypothetical protein